jgi:hypothetical protein
MKMGWCDFLLCWGEGGSVCSTLVGLNVILAKKKIYSYIHVRKIPYTQDISLMHVYV